MQIAFLDLNRLNAPYLEAFHRRLDETVKQRPFILGPLVEAFERAWAQYTGAHYAIGTGNGTDALFLILEAYKLMGRLRPGDAVLVPAHTYIATILPVLRAGLHPVLVEPDPDTHIVPVGQYAMYAGDRRIKAVVAVHLYGRVAVDPLLQQLAQDEGWLLIEDAAQAHGAGIDGRHAGNLGHAAAWSFYPTKNLGALGDAGAVTTNDGRLAELVAVLRHYGQTERYYSRYRGINSRLDALQAAFLLEKLPALDALNRRRIQIARRYVEGLANPLVQVPIPAWDGSHVYHQFVVTSPARDLLRRWLQRQGIQTLIHYPQPPHRQPALAGVVDYPLPVTDEIYGRLLSLPVDPLLTDEEVDYVIEQVNRFRP